MASVIRKSSTKRTRAPAHAGDDNGAMAAAVTLVISALSGDPRADLTNVIKLLPEKERSRVAAQVRKLTMRRIAPGEVHDHSVYSRLETAALLGCSVKTLSRLEEKRSIGPLIKITERLGGYRGETIKKYLASRESAA